VPRDQGTVSSHERDALETVASVCKALNLPAPQHSVSRWGFEMDLTEMKCETKLRK
jgi:hypothetical protein